MNDKINISYKGNKAYIYVQQLQEVVDTIATGGIDNSSGDLLEMFISANGEEDAKKAQEQFDREQHKIDQSIE